MLSNMPGFAFHISAKIFVRQRSKSGSIIFAVGITQLIHDTVVYIYRRILLDASGPTFLGGSSTELRVVSKLRRADSDEYSEQ